MNLLKRARGVEHEYIMNTDPPLALDDNVERRRLIANAIEGLKESGFLFPHVTWAVRGEDGNLAYENSLYRLWPLGTRLPAVGKNGMRIYDDALHLEIATPVYSTPVEALVYAKVSEYLAFMASQKVRPMVGRPVYCYTSNISLLKSRKANYEAVSCGTHGNMTVSRNVFNATRMKEVQRALIPYMVARIIVSGSGGYVPFILDDKGHKTNKFGSLGSPEASGSTLVGDDICFAISPRCHFVNCRASEDTTVKRGFVNLRDEPHAEKDSYWRLHDINWEGIRSDLQIYIRDILHAFVIAAFEKGYLDDAPVLRDPLGDMKLISLDMNYNWKVKLINGELADAVQDILINYYLHKIEAMLDREKAGGDDLAAFGLLSKFLAVFNERDMDSLIYLSDWVTKLYISQACDTPLEGLLACNQFCLVDREVLSYTGEDDSTDSGDSLFDAHESLSSFVKWVPEITLDGFRSAICRGIYQPPASTRETVRIQSLAKNSSVNMEANWAFVANEDGAEQLFSEPLG